MMFTVYVQTHLEQISPRAYAINQAIQFRDSVGVDSIALTKLDGTAKGGVIVGICDELKIPVKFIGIGEQVDDLRPFEAEQFIDALF